MNTEQVIKALEHCSANRDCKLCSYHKCIACVDILLKDALALIKEQQAEIEKYKKLADLNEQDNKDTCELLFKEEDKNKELQAHNENLKRENKYLREKLAEEMEHKEDMEGKK